MKNRYLLLAFVFPFIFAACSKDTFIAEPEVNPPAAYVSDSSFKIVGYFPSYRDPAGVDPSKYKMVTHLFYAFLNPRADGSLAPLSQPGRFNTVIQQAKARGVKTGISVSGDAAIFVSMAASATTRTAFVKNALAFVRSNELDGLDMDWEYPRQNVSDETYALLMKELSDSLHKHNKFLSAAITPGVYAGTVRDGIRTEVFSYADFFNIMIYDGAGWQGELNHASYNMTVASLNYWLNTRGMPRKKAVLGMPAYGKTAGGTAATVREFEAAGIDITGDYARYNNTDYYFNGSITIKQKTALASQRCNGIMFWEIYQDTNSAGSIIKAANDQLGRNYN
ncbi:glycosyl hydrolase family 18 protein [Pedobacter sp. SYP-B3415]|uniref:glycosyl hydrolase family 18 protein n=1 Tax=Pedobacter sp. SYP-B3415 TaxID=2496641 RepID=UPI00101C8F6C|nr:glycosyl hydrolase family 18 protein [Pedobacter sp. SYP-B3415]